MNKKENRIAYCDFIRFFAMCCIILIHVLGNYRNYYLPINKYHYSILTFLDSFPRAGVPLFLMLTGAFMLNTKSDKNYLTFLKKKLPKLIIPFIIFSFMYYVYKSVDLGLKISLIKFIEEFTEDKIQYHFWFMYTIILIYLLIPFIKRMVQNLSKTEIIIFLIVIFSSTLLLMFKNILSIFSLNLFSHFIYPSFLIYIGYVILGYLLFNYNFKDKKYLYVLSCISLFLMPILDYITVKPQRNDLFLVASSPFALILSITTFLFIKNHYNSFHIPPKLQQFFSHSAKFIFYIYMIHVMVMNIFKRFILKYPIPYRFIHALLLIAIEFIFTLIISYICGLLIYHLLERAKYIYNKKLSKHI